MGLFQWIDAALARCGIQDGEELTIRAMLVEEIRGFNLSCWHDWRRTASVESCEHLRIIRDPARGLYWCADCPWTATEREIRYGEARVGRRFLLPIATIYCRGANPLEPETMCAETRGEDVHGERSLRTVGG